MHFCKPLLALLLLFTLAACGGDSIPDDFVLVNDAIPDAVYEVRYTGDNNFTGRPVTGYSVPHVYLTAQAADALKQVQADLVPFGLCLKIFDGFRPQRAVDDFVAWGKDLQDLKMKAQYYPEVDKANLFKEGYIASKSGHSRGSTVDVTIVDTKSGKELDMGTPFDFFGTESWPKDDRMDASVRTNRALLRAAMMRRGFLPYEQEWWHFTLKDEPHPDTYFDFEIK